MKPGRQSLTRIKTLVLYLKKHALQDGIDITRHVKKPNLSAFGIRSRREIRDSGFGIRSRCIRIRLDSGFEIWAGVGANYSILDN